MATIKYNGMELDEVTTPQIFDPPKRCVVWDDDPLNLNQSYVIAIFPDSVRLKSKVMDWDLCRFQHCAILPGPSKPRKATNRELARWLAQGNGEWVVGCGSDAIHLDFLYHGIESEQTVDDTISVRKWSDIEWHEPTVDYLGIDDKDYAFNKKYGDV